MCYIDHGAEPPPNTHTRIWATSRFCNFVCLYFCQTDRMIVNSYWKEEFKQTGTKTMFLFGIKEQLETKTEAVLCVEVHFNQRPAGGAVSADTVNSGNDVAVGVEFIPARLDR